MMTALTGDGITDDAPTLQALLDAGGWVRVPAGAYRLGGLLRISARTRLSLDPAAVLIRDHDDVILTNTPAGGGAGGYAAHGDILIEGGVWDVRATARPAYAGAVAVAHATGITVRDLTALDVPGWHAVEVNACRTVRIRDCRFAGFVHEGDRGYSEAVQLDSATEAGVYPWGGPYDGTPCDDVEVSGCWVGASGTPGTQAWPRGVGSHNVAGRRQVNVRVHGNTFDGVSDCGVHAVAWERAMISKNHVLQSGGEGIAVRSGSMYVDVTGNQVFDSGRTGVWLNDNVTQVCVRDNTIIGSGAAEHAAHYGIRGSSTCSWLMITGNKVRRRSSGAHAAYGLSLTSACSKVLRYGNDLRTSGVNGAVQDQSVSPVTAATDAM